MQNRIRAGGSVGFPINVADPCSNYSATDKNNACQTSFAFGCCSGNAKNDGSCTDSIDNGRPQATFSCVCS